MPVFHADQVTEAAPPPPTPAQAGAPAGSDWFTQNAPPQTSTKRLDKDAKQPSWKDKPLVDFTKLGVPGPTKKRETLTGRGADKPLDTIQKVARGVVGGVESTASGFTSPESAALLVGTWGLSTEAGPALKVANKLISTGFGVQQLKAAWDKIPAFREAIKKGDIEGATRTATEGGISAGMGASALAHAAPKAGEAPKPGPMAPTGEPPKPVEAKPSAPAKRTPPPMSMSNEALEQLLKVEPSGPKRDALAAEARKRGVEVHARTTRAQESAETLAETARIDSQFDIAEKKLAEKQKSQLPAKDRKTKKPPFIPETGTPENVARTQAAREAIIGKPPEQWSNSDITAADELIAQGYTGAPSGKPGVKSTPADGSTAKKAATRTPAETDALRQKILEKPKSQWTASDVEAADALIAEGHVGSTRPSPAPPRSGSDNALTKKTQKQPKADTAQNKLTLTAETPAAPAEPTPVVLTSQSHAASEEAPPAFKDAYVVGKSGQAKTARGYKVPFKYAVVDADSLITSHDPATLQENPAFDQSIQPRDRSRAGYEEQINTMTGLLDPEELGHSYKASDGAPIVGDDAMVESGNGRTIALKRVYESHGDKAAEYSDWLKENAEQFGLDPEQVAAIKKPVLVRLRTGLPENVSRAEFAKHANEDAKATMGAVETAASDSEALTPGVMALFEPSENGDINTAGNRAFVQKFAQSVVGPGQKNPFMLADGSISSEGVRRIKNAIFAKAYGGSTALDKLAEDPSDNTKSITNGLVQAAPKFADMQAAIERGDLYDLNPSPAISRAVSRLSHLRASKTSIQDFLAQEDMYGKDPLEGKILDIFDRHKRSAARIADVFKAYSDAVEAVGSPKQSGLFAQRPPTVMELLQAADDKITAEQEARERAKEEKSDARPLFEK